MSENAHGARAASPIPRPMRVTSSCVNVVVKPEASVLLRAIHRRDGLEMPPSKKLPDTDIDTLTRWVKAGAPWTPGVEIVQASEGGKVTPESRHYWAYKPLQRPQPPVLSHRNDDSGFTAPLTYVVGDQTKAIASFFTL